MQNIRLFVIGAVAIAAITTMLVAITRSDATATDRLEAQDVFAVFRGADTGSRTDVQTRNDHVARISEAAGIQLDPTNNRVALREDTHTLTAMAGTAAVCLEDSEAFGGSGGGCGDLTGFVGERAHPMVGVVPGNESESQMRVFGLVPDGIRDLVLHAGDSSEKLEVENSAFTALVDAAEGADAITWINADGTSGTTSLRYAFHDESK